MCSTHGARSATNPSPVSLTFPPHCSLSHTHTHTHTRTHTHTLAQAKETLIRERQEIYSARESAKANLDAKMNERRDLKSQTKFKSVEEIDKRIAELDQLQHTTSMPLKVSGLEIGRGLG